MTRISTEDSERQHHGKVASMHSKKGHAASRAQQLYAESSAGWIAGDRPVRKLIGSVANHNFLLQTKTFVSSADIMQPHGHIN